MELAFLVVFLITLRFIIRNTRTYKLFLAVFFMIAAIPAGIFTEIGANGCCGAPSTGHEGIGFVVMALLFFGGLALLVLTLKSKK